MTQPRRDGWQVDRLDQTTGSIVAEAMRMHVRDLCASAQLGDQVLDPARRVRPTLATEHGATDVDVVDRHGLDRLQRFARLDVQRQPPALVALANDVDPAGASVKLDALAGERDQLVDAQSGVVQQYDDRLGHRPVFLGLADEPSALDVGKPLRSERLCGDVGQVVGGVADDPLGLGRPAEKPTQGGQSGVDRGRLLTLAELGFVLAQVARGGLQECGLIALLEPGGEALQVGDVLAGSALADPSCRIRTVIRRTVPRY